MTISDQMTVHVWGAAGEEEDKDVCHFHSSPTFVLPKGVLKVSCLKGESHLIPVLLTPSVPGRVFIFILLNICRFYTALETHVGIRIVQTLAINLLTSIDQSRCE